MGWCGDLGSRCRPHEVAVVWPEQEPNRAVFELGSVVESSTAVTLAATRAAGYCAILMAAQRRGEGEGVAGWSDWRISVKTKVRASELVGRECM